MRYWLCLTTVLGFLVCGACRPENARGVHVDAKLASLVPHATTALGGIDVDRVKASGFYRRHSNELNLALLDQASGRLGLDPRRDLKEVLLAWHSNQPLILARGTFSAKDIQPRIVALGARETRYRNRILFGGPDEAVFFPEQNLLAAGPLSALHALIEGGNGGIPSPVRSRLENLPNSDQVWAVSTEGFPVDRLPMRSSVTSGLSNLVRYLSAASIGAGLDEGAHFQAELNCFSADGAKQVHDALRGVIGMARLMTKDNDLDMLRLYDAIQVEQDQKTIHVHADLPAELSDKLLKYLPRK